MAIEFDPNKDASNLTKHGLSLKDADRFEWDTAVIHEDMRQRYAEQRFKATGLIGERLYVMIYCLRSDNVRAISLRRATNQEKRRYAREISNLT